MVPNPFSQFGLGSQSSPEAVLGSLHPKSQILLAPGLCLLVQTSPLKPLIQLGKIWEEPEDTGGAWG